MHKSNYKFVLPRLAADEVFPITKFQEYYLLMIAKGSTDLNVWSLGAYTKIFIFKLGKFKKYLYLYSFSILLLNIDYLSCLKNTVQKKTAILKSYQYTLKKKC